MTIKELLLEGTKILKDTEIEAPERQAGVLLCHALNCDRAHIYSHGEENIGIKRTEEFLITILKRLDGMPLQYITGKQEFMSIDFRVGSGVLIPRPETELLVMEVLKYLEDRSLENMRKECFRVLELGTGSGCVSVSIAKYFNKCHITAVEKSSEALDFAICNAKNAGVSDRIDFICDDIFNCLEQNYNNHLFGSSFDVIVSNPPYARTQDISLLQREVKNFEPKIALDGGIDGLDFYRGIIAAMACISSDEQLVQSAKAPRILHDEGLLAFEIGQGQGSAVTEMIQDLNKQDNLLQCFSDIRISKDLAGIERVVTCVYRLL